MYKHSSNHDSFPHPHAASPLCSPRPRPQRPTPPPPLSASPPPAASPLRLPTPRRRSRLRAVLLRCCARRSGLPSEEMDPVDLEGSQGDSGQGPLEQQREGEDEPTPSPSPPPGDAPAQIPPAGSGARLGFLIGMPASSKKGGARGRLPPVSAAVSGRKRGRSATPVDSSSGGKGKTPVYDSLNHFSLNLYVLVNYLLLNLYDALNYLSLLMCDLNLLLNYELLSITILNCC